MKVLNHPSVLIIVLCAWGGYAHAGPYVVLGPSDNFALDQPRIAIEVVSGATSYGPPPEANSFLLDTGAQGLLTVGYAATEMLTSGYDDTAAVYNELGIAGTTPYNVSAEYDLRFAGSSGTPIYTLPDVRIMSDENSNFGGFNGIIGMPAMLQRVTTLDMTAMKGTGLDELDLGDLLNMDLDFGFMGVSFADALPADTGHRYSVPLTLQDFAPAGQVNPTDPLPTFEPLPFAQVNTSHQGLSGTGSFLIDTGAQLSLISKQTALSLGMDTSGNNELEGDEVLAWIEIGGVGGAIRAPVVALDQLSVQTDQGVELIWTDLNVLVVDIVAEPGADPLAGIFGCDLLTSGWTQAVLGAGAGVDSAILALLEMPEYADLADLLNGILQDLLLGEELDPRLLAEIDLGGLDLLQFLEEAENVPEAGYLQQVSFDFLNSDNMAGSMVFDLTSEVDNVVPEPASLALLAIGAVALLKRRAIC